MKGYLIAGDGNLSGNKTKKQALQGLLLIGAALVMWTVVKNSYRSHSAEVEVVTDIFQQAQFEEMPYAPLFVENINERQAANTALNEKYGGVPPFKVVSIIDMLRGVPAYQR